MCKYVHIRQFACKHIRIRRALLRSDQNHLDLGESGAFEVQYYRGCVRGREGGGKCGSNGGCIHENNQVQGEGCILGGKGSGKGAIPFTVVSCMPAIQTQQKQYVITMLCYIFVLTE